MMDDATIQTPSAPERHHTPALASTVFALTAICGLMAMALYPLTMNTPLPGGWGVTGNPLADLINAIQAALLVPLVSGTFGLIIVRRQSDNRIGWLLLLLGLAAAFSVLGGNWSIFAYYTVEQPLPFAQVAGWATNWMWIVVFTILLLLISLFPDGQFLSPRWKVALLGVIALFALPLLIATMIETPMTSAFFIPSPFVTDRPQQIYDTLFQIGVPFMPVTAILVLIEVLVRFRQTGGIQRQQIKWLLAGVALLVVMVVVGLYLTLILSNPLGDVMVNSAVLAPLTGIGIAMLRHRLYDIDVIIRRTLVYSLLTGMLLLIYFGSVILLQRIFGLVTGQQSTLAVVLSTLLIASLFNPLRRRLQRLIERRFYRRRYNAQQVLARFSEAV